jgi:hypothetical protein
VATHDAKEATGLLSTAQDLARYKGISLTDASRMLTSTMTGSTRAARQLGITFKPGHGRDRRAQEQDEYASLAAYEHAKSVAFMADKQASAAKMVGLLNDKLGGQARRLLRRRRRAPRRRWAPSSSCSRSTSATC